MNVSHQTTIGNGCIVSGVIAPHPPHLIYAENAPQNEPRAEGGWEVLRWGYESLRKKIDQMNLDALVVFSPHWQTYIGTHFLCVPHLRGKSVDPIFPNLFRFNYDLKVDCALSKDIFTRAQQVGLESQLMVNPDFRVDYGTLVSCHMLRPQWDIPIVVISSERLTHYYSAEVMQRKMLTLGQATRDAVLQSGKRVLLVASHSLSHRHFTSERDVPEDMSAEHIYNHSQYLWDMQVIDLIKKGKSKELFELIPDFTEQAIAETDSGALSWLISSMGFPRTAGEVFAYGSVIGTGNAIVEWPLEGLANAK